MKFRSLIFWLHLTGGVVTGLVILVMAVTGLLLSFERPVTQWAERSLYSAPHPAGAQRLGPEALLAKAVAARPNARPFSISLRADVTQPVIVGFGRESGALFLDPYSGEAHEMSGTRSFFRLMEDLHRRLAMGAFGQNITGVVVIVFLFMVLTGLVLWFPRSRAHWTRNTWRAFTVPNLKLRGKAREWSLHNAIGLWSSPLLLAITLTGTVMSHPWAADLLYRATGNTPPPRQQNNAPAKQGPPGGQQQQKPMPPPRLGGLDKLWTDAESAAPGWQSITLRVPGALKSTLAFQVDMSEGGRPDKRFQLNIDPKTGAVTGREQFQDYDMGRKLRMWMQPIHTGLAFGYLGCFLGALVACSTLLLIWTGISLACRRLIARKKHVADLP